MQLSKILKMMCLVILVSLAYVNVQMKIISLAYQEEQYKQRARELVENNGNINYKISTLKSANNLGIEVLADNSDFQFGDPEQVRKMLAPEISSFEQGPSERASSQSANPLLSFLSRKERTLASNTY